MISPQGVLVGLSISLTGRYSRQGQQALDGIRLWQFYCDAHERWPVRLVYYDDESRVSQARQNARKLIVEDHVDVLFGPYGSELTMAVAQVAEERQKILWNYGGSSDEIFNRGCRYLVGVPSPASDYFRGLPQWLVKWRLSLRQICVVRAPRGTFASQVARGVEEAAKSTGRHSIALVLMTDSVFQELCAASAELLILAGSFEEEVGLIRMRHRWPGTVQVVAAVAAGVTAFYEEAREAAEGVIGPSQWEPDAPAAVTEGPDSGWFVRNFAERFGRDPDYIAAGGFAAGLVFAASFRRAGSLEDSRLREVAGSLDFSTLYGGFRIDPATGRQIGHAILLTEWQQGRKVLLK